MFRLQLSEQYYFVCLRQRTAHDRADITFSFARCTLYIRALHQCPVSFSVC